MLNKNVAKIFENLNEEQITELLAHMQNVVQQQVEQETEGLKSTVASKDSQIQMHQKNNDIIRRKITPLEADVKELLKILGTKMTSEELLKATSSLQSPVGKAVAGVQIEVSKEAEKKALEEIKSKQETGEIDMTMISQ